MRKTYPENKGLLTDPDAITQYIHGGRGIVMLQSPSGKSHTYMFSKPVNPSTFPDDVIFVFAVHEGVKQFYIGMIELDEFRLTKHSRFLPDTEIVRGAQYIIRMADHYIENNKMQLWHMGVCARCGRKLSTEKSILTGIGPKCMRKLNNVDK